jgi:hypothetical protein
MSSQRAHVSPEHSKALCSSSPGSPVAIYRPPFGIEMSKDKTSWSWVFKKLVQPLVNAYPSICNWNASHNWKCQVSHTNHIPHVIKWCGLYSKQLHLYKTDTILATKVLPSKNSNWVKIQLHIVKDVGMWSIITSICPVIHPSIRPIIHSSCHGLFTPTENSWLCLEGLSHVAFRAFAFPVLPFSSQSGKVYEKKQEKKKTCLWWKNRKNTYYFFFF